MSLYLINPLKQICLHFSSAIDEAEGAVKGSLHREDGNGSVLVHISHRTQGCKLTLVTLNRPPCFVTIVRHLDARRDHPFLPGNFAANLIPYRERQISHERSNEIDKIFRIDH